jgi:LPS-assembly lipoprotein
MWLSDRRNLLIGSVALLLAGACGFTPVYGPNGIGTALNGKVNVAEPTDRDTYLLVQELEQRFGQPVSSEYDLTLALLTVTEGEAVTASGDITRFSLVGEVEYALTHRTSQTRVSQGVVRNFTGYSATGSTVETLASERDAQERLMIIIADQIVAQIYATAELVD